MHSAGRAACALYIQAYCMYVLRIRVVDYTVVPCTLSLERERKALLYVCREVGSQCMHTNAYAQESDVDIHTGCTVLLVKYW